MIKMRNLISYYILLLTGLIGASWIIWSRFIRERVIRDIPDSLLTEYRVWILVYICSIYLFTIKNFIKQTQPNIILVTFIDVIRTHFWKPLITLDHGLKYNKYWKEHYYTFMLSIIDRWSSLNMITRTLILLGFQVIPRIILGTFLLLDTFYFSKLEIFYKVVLIGILPFSFNYFEYSCKDFYEYLVKQLTDKYAKVYIFEKGYSYDISRKCETKALWHNEFISIQEYIEIIYDMDFEEDVSYKYEGDPYCKDEVYNEYKKKFNKSVSDWTSNEDKEVNKLFHDLIPIILDLKAKVKNLHILKEKYIIAWPKIFIYGMYFVCWCYILLISYYNYPIELRMFKNLIVNFMSYLIIGDGEDPFIGISYSFNENLITIENVKNLIKNIIIKKIESMFK